MIGLFDSGHGGLTIYNALVERFSEKHFIYLGDHANAPYGNQDSSQIIELTRKGVESLFLKGCKLVLLACNTATAVAARTLQQNWLPQSEWQDHNILGIIAPTVEAATQTPWAVTTPQYPQKYNDDMIIIFATQRTVTSDVYPEEIKKRCPKVEVIQQACPKLVSAIETGAPQSDLEQLISQYVKEAMELAEGRIPHRVILGCTHYPLAEDIFKKLMPTSSRFLSQPSIVADSLEDYLSRHPQFIPENFWQDANLFSTGNISQIEQTLSIFGDKTFSFKNL